MSPGEAGEVEIRASRMLGAGLGAFLRHNLPAGQVVLREHVLVAQNVGAHICAAAAPTGTVDICVESIDSSVI